MLETLVALTVVSVVALYVWLTWNYSYWKSRGLKQLHPKLFYGDVKDIIHMKHNEGLLYEKLYWKYPEEPVIGLYKARQPQLLVRDAELLRTMLIKEFSSFHDNDISEVTSFDPVLRYHPFVARGERWKPLRAVTSSAMTLNKLKGMVLAMVKVCKDLVNHLEENQDKFLDCKYLGGQVTADVVTACVFGTKSNSFKEPDSLYRSMITRVLNPEFANYRFMLMRTFPKLASLLQIRFIPKDVTDFFLQYATEATKFRKDNAVQSNDFLQQLINTTDKDGNPSYSMEEVTAHSVTFLVDGYETSAVFICHVLDLLGQHPQVQEKLRGEVRASLATIDYINFDVLHSMPYLDAVINEVLRLRPPGTVLGKVCTKSTTLHCQGKSFHVEEGTSVVVPVFAVHHDPKYFADPEKFLPDRFLGLKSPPLGFLPFGLGPRACLGNKFATTQVKAAVASIVSKFEIIPKEARTCPPEFDEKSTIFLMVKGGVWSKFRKLST